LRVFADTFFWVGSVLPGDPWAPVVGEWKASNTEALIVTTEEVLTEFLATFSGRGEHLRKKAAEAARSILTDPRVMVVHQSHESFLAGLALYERRLDKGYSLVDCISMNVMRRQRIRRALTNDRHFGQEGFTVLVS